MGVGPDRTIRDAAQLMDEAGVGSLAVDDRLIDLASDLADLARPITAEVLFPHHDSAPLATT